MKFKVGDRVIVTRYVGNGERDNQHGRVIKINPIDDGHNSHCVEFDEYMGGHNGNCGKPIGKQGHCWWVSSDDLIPESPEIEVGDEVEIIDKGHNAHDEVGQRFIVTGIRANPFKDPAEHIIERSDGHGRCRHRCKLVRKASKIKEATMDKEFKIMESKVKEVMAMCPEWKKGLAKLFEGQIKEEKTYRIGMRFKNVKDEYIIASTATTPTGTTHVIMVSLKEWPGCRQGDGVEVKSAFNITESEMSSWLGSDWKDKWELISE